MKLYNTLTRQIEDFKPINDMQVKLYTCGLTVYAQPHIGNWVGYIYWDVLVRVLKNTGFNVTRTQNYTDVGHLVSDDDSGEDKMEKGAKREGLTAWDVADKYIRIAEHEAYELLALDRPNYLVRATDFIAQQIEFVKELEKRGFTYAIEDEGIYFDTSKLSDYGKLARIDAKGLQAGKRVAITGKRNITDFALWKFSPRGTKRDMEWDSPWGKGFPGWHLECSVIARETLGDEIDIHTGGVDHIPVHHTNEIAQTEALTGKPFAHFWLHNNHLKVEGGKMAKSLGNIYTLEDITKHGYDIEAFKLMILSKHYRTEGNFTWEILAAAQNRLKSFRAMADLQWQMVDKPDMGIDSFDHAQKEILKHLETDLNTPLALTELSRFQGVLENELLSKNDVNRFKDFLKFIDDVFGFNLANGSDITTEQKEIINERQEAREASDWARSDELRARLIEQGIEVRDTSDGPVWAKL